VPTLRIAALVPVDEAEGPGSRVALWVQGCSLRCPGCCNPQMFDPHGGREATPADVLAAVDRERGRLEGVTFVGGEPFEQAEALAEVARGARARGLGVVVFSGYPLEELRGGRAPGADGLLAQTDLLVDGRHRRDRPDAGRRWVGSTNQCFHFLTGRYRPGIEVLSPGADTTAELRIGPGGAAARAAAPLTTSTGGPARGPPRAG